MIVGPVLGSGILIFPTLVYDMANDWAIVAWAAISGVGLLVAILFGQLSIHFVGEAGASRAVESAFGSEYRSLATVFLMFGVLVGADAVLLTAAEYLHAVLPLSSVLLAIILLTLCALLLFFEIKAVAGVALVMSILSSGFLLFGAAGSLSFHSLPVAISTPFAAQPFFSALFLLFWTVFGWEVIGNYSADVKRPQRDIPRAVLISCTVIAVASLTVAAGVQWSGSGGRANGSLSAMIADFYGTAGTVVLAGLAVFLCVSTYLLYLGGLGRQIASLSDDGTLPRFLGVRTKGGVATSALSILILFNAVLFGPVYLGWLDLAGMVTIANGFLVSNALLSVAAAVVVLDRLWIRIGGAVVVLAFFGLLLANSTVPELVVIGALTLFFAIRSTGRSRRTRDR
jgi:APA family basic amino acid/polyamine antiporter